MMEFYVSGQSLKMFTPVIAADSLKYLTAQFHFTDDDWDGYTRWAHFRSGETVYDIELDGEDCITEEDALNLTAGEWEIYLTGTKDAARLTTIVVILTVKESGLIDAPLHVLPQSVAEQIDAKAAQALLTAQAVKAAADAGKFNGKDGKSFEIKGYYASTAALEEGVPAPGAGRRLLRGKCCTIRRVHLRRSKRRVDQQRHDTGRERRHRRGRHDLYPAP